VFLRLIMAVTNLRLNVCWNEL